MPLSVTPITSQNRREALSLRVAAGQEGFIESVSQCLSEADENPVWHPLGIYDRGTMVGFSMYGFFPMESAPEGRLWLDRLLIDRRFQGRGYGRAALAALLERLRDPSRQLKAEIAAEMEVSPQTVNYHIGQALKVLGVALKDYLPLIALFFEMPGNN